MTLYIYLHVFPDTERDATATLDRLLGGASTAQAREE